MTDKNSLARLIEETLALQGGALPAEFDPQAIEIEIEGRKLRLLAHEDPGHALLEVDVGGLAADQLLSADLLQLLHRINHEARFTHRWIAVIDDSDALVVSLTLTGEAVSAQQLTAWIQEGIDRASALEALVNLESAEAGAATEPFDPALGRSGPAILA